jgi:hypothetical protein
MAKEEGIVFVIVIVLAVAGIITGLVMGLTGDSKLCPKGKKVCKCKEGNCCCLPCTQGFHRCKDEDGFKTKCCLDDSPPPDDPNIPRTKETFLAYTFL